MISPRRANRLKKLLQREMKTELREKMKDILKPKPKYWPWWFWKMMIKKLLDIPEI